MRVANQEMIKIDGEKFKKDLSQALKEKMGMSVIEASRRILRKGDGYIGNSFARNKIDSNSLDILMAVTGLDANDYVEKKEPEEPKPEEKPDVIVGINNVYNLLNTLLTEQKTTNSLLREILSRNSTDREVVKTMGSNITKATEKLKAIYTDVHYNMKF